MWLKRWRNTHGFGVHSPFGFQFTQRVVNLGKKYSFYAEEELRNQAAHLNLNRTALNDAVMLLRLNALSPVSAARISRQAKELSPLITEAWRAAGLTDINIVDSPVDIIVNKLSQNSATILAAVGSELTLEDMTRHLTTPGNTLFIIDAPRGVSRQLLQNENLLIISGPKNLLAIRRPQMQSLLYHMHI